jgi:hypothetical protein
MVSHVASCSAIALFLLLLAPTPVPAASPAWSRAEVPAGFWKTWGDGKAELAAYDLTFTRYGAPRGGVAVAIFVPEIFSNELRVKADPGKHPAADEFPVMKLNLVQDFPTGIYDYNLMTSAFSTLAAVNGHPAGAPAKVSFSSQEWCGQAYAQLLFDSDAIRHESHSYFDGEADQAGKLAYPVGGVSEDALLLWARGWAAPRLGPGESREVPILRSLAYARLRHKPTDWAKATLSRAAQPARAVVPAGTFTADVYRAAIRGGPTWTFHVERSAPHRIVQWERSDGEKAVLIRGARLKYWEMNAKGQERSLAEIGLKPRPARAP